MARKQHFSLTSFPRLVLAHISTTLPFFYRSYVHAAPTAGSVPSSIQWHNCTAADPPLLDCGELQVPLDWGDPSGKKITLGMVRAQAADASKRLGNLIFNPGGPGSAASQFVEEAAGVFTAGVLEHFDIIGLDPRGVGLSSRIQCDPDIFNERVSVFPSDQASFTKMVKKQRALGESCLSLTGPLLGHIDSVSVARDVEAVREALGDEKLNFLGLSYGSLLGATYAEL